MAKVNERLGVFNIDSVRSEMWRGIKPPAEILNKAFERLNEELDAQKTEFFAHQGLVITQKDVVDHASRQGAIDKVLKVAGGYAREADTKNQTPMVAVEVDPVTGTLRMIIGGTPAPGGANEVIENDHNEPEGSVACRAQLALPESQLSLFDAIGVTEEKEEIEEVQVLKRPRGDKTPPEVLKMLFRGDVG